MIWASLGEFLAMGGYATYVWGSYAVVLIAIVLEIVVLRQRRRRAFEQLHHYLKHTD
jgi:heme exporter protein D